MISNYSFGNLPVIGSLFYNTNSLILMLIIYPMLFMWQGIDLTDQGYALTTYQRIFDDPPTVLEKLTLLYWLSAVIGGLWNQIFGGLGALAFKLAYVFNVYLILLCVYYTLKEYFNRTQLLFALLLTLMFVNKAVVNWIQYNSLTSLFYVAAGFLLLHGLKKQSHAPIFLAALILGLNIFIKIPNILGLSLILVPIFYGYLSHFSTGQYFRIALLFISGSITGVIVILLAMHYIGHLELYLDAFINIFSRLSAKSDGHSANALVILLIKDSIRMMVFSVFSICSVVICSILLSRVHNKPVQYFSILGLSVVAYYGLAHLESWKWIYPGAIIFVLLYYILRTDKYTTQIRTIACISLVFLYAASFGSDNGIRNMIFGIWLGLPMAILFLLQAQPIEFFKRILTPQSMAFVQKLVLSIVIVSTLIIAFRYTYRDNPDRFLMVHPVSHPMLKGQFTTKDRANSLQELITALSGYVKEDDHLFAYEHIQLVYYLTKTRPYLYHSWPMLYPPEDFGTKLKQAQREKKELPIVVRAKSNTKTRYWPQDVDRGLQITDSHINDCRLIAIRFLKANKYTVVWENTFFQILAPLDSNSLL